MMDYNKFEPIPLHPNYLINQDGVIIIKDTQEKVEILENNMVHLVDEYGLIRRYPVDRLVLTIFSQLNFLDTNSFDVTHLNKNKYDNSLNNLRWTTRNITSRFNGVYWRMDSNLWEANIHIKKKKKYIGSFKNEVIAAMNIEIEKRKYIGQDGRFNLQDSEMKIPIRNKKHKKYHYPTKKIYLANLEDIESHTLRKFPNYIIYKNGVILNQKNGKLVNGFINNGVRVVYIIDWKGCKKSFCVDYLLYKCRFYDYPFTIKRKRARKKWEKSMCTKMQFN